MKKKELPKPFKYGNILVTPMVIPSTPPEGMSTDQHKWLLHGGCTPPPGTCKKVRNLKFTKNRE